MGDRGNYKLVYGEKYPPIYLYSHWDGGAMLSILADALNSREGRNRWDDEAYLARIIFTHLTRNAGPELGYGIAPYLVDEDRSPIIVNLVDKTVNGTSYDEFLARMGRVEPSEEPYEIPAGQRSKSEAMADAIVEMLMKKRHDV